MTDVLIKRGNLDIDMDTGKTPYEHESRDWGDASTNQGMPKIAIKPLEARTGAQLILSQPLEGSYPANPRSQTSHFHTMTQ